MESPHATQSFANETSFTWTPTHHSWLYAASQAEPVSTARGHAPHSAGRRWTTAIRNGNGSHFILHALLCLRLVAVQVFTVTVTMPAPIPTHQCYAIGQSLVRTFHDHHPPLHLLQRPCSHISLYLTSSEAAPKAFTWLLCTIAAATTAMRSPLFRIG